MFMSLSTVLNNNKNLKNGGAYWNRGAYLQKHILWGALIRKGALIGRRALNRIITVLVKLIFDPIFCNNSATLQLNLKVQDSQAFHTSGGTFTPPSQILKPLWKLSSQRRC